MHIWGRRLWILVASGTGTSQTLPGDFVPGKAAPGCQSSFSGRSKVRREFLCYESECQSNGLVGQKWASPARTCVTAVRHLPIVAHFWPLIGQRHGSLCGWHVGWGRRIQISMFSVVLGFQRDGFRCCLLVQLLWKKTLFKRWEIELE